MLIADVLHNPSDAPQTVTYTIYPVNPSAVCGEGPPQTVTITVNPTPQVVPVVTETTLCNDAATDITLTSPSTFSNGDIRFRYTVTATGGVTGFTASVTDLPLGHVIADVLHNPADAPQTVTYTIYPVNPSAVCGEGPAQTVTITVNPTPQVDLPVNQVVCNNSLSQHVIFTTPNSGVTVSNTWTNDLPSIGLAAGGTGDIPSFTAINGGNSPITATIVVTPYFEIGPVTCTGPSKTFTITIDPTPQAVPSILTQTICNNGVTNIVIGSPSTFSSGVVTFNYTVAATGGVTGFTTLMNGLPKDYIITDVLVNPTNEVQTVTYTIVPVNSTGCASGPATVIVTVLPTAQVNKPDDQVLCNGENSIPVSLGTLTIGTVSFTWTNDQPSIGLPAYGSGDIPSFVAENNSDSPIITAISVTPHFIIGSISCTGEPKVFTITVNPTPQVVPVVTETTLCNDAATDITLTSPSTFSNGDIRFRYTVTATGGVTGFTASVTDLPLGHVIADVLHNPSDAPQTVTYKIYPVNPSAVCGEGPPQTVTITVNPTPQVVPVVTETTLCNDAATDITLTSPSTFSNGDIRFRYTVTATGGVTGFTASVTDLPLGHVIADVLHNPSDAPQTVTYTRSIRLTRRRYAVKVRHRR